MDHPRVSVDMRLIIKTKSARIETRRVPRRWFSSNAFRQRRYHSRFFREHQGVWIFRHLLLRAICPQLYSNPQLLYQIAGPADQTTRVMLFTTPQYSRSCLTGWPRSGHVHCDFFLNGLHRCRRMPNGAGGRRRAGFLPDQFRAPIGRYGL